MEIGYFENLGFLILSYSIIFLIGHFIYGFFDTKVKNPVQSIFLKNVLGIWAIVFTYSLWKTNLFSINLVFIILIIFLLIGTKIKPAISFKLNFPLLFFQFLSLIIFYSVFYFKYYNPFDHTYHALFSDFPGYAAIVEKMNTHGLESRFPDYFYNPPVRELYHYGDLWLSAFFARIFKKNALTTFYFIMFPLVTMIFYTGILGLINPKKINYKTAIICLSFLFISTISIFYPKSIPFFNTEWGEFTMLNSPKRTMAGLVLLTGIILATEKKHLLVILSLLAIVGIYTISAPMVFVFCTLFILYLFLTKQIQIKKAIFLFMPLIFSGLFLIIYMKVCADINLNYLPKETPKMIDLSSLRFDTYILTAIKSFIGLVIKLILGTTPFILLYLFFSQKDKSINKKLALVSMIIFSGFFVHSILYFVAESNQLYTVTYIPAIAVFVLLLINPVFEANKSIVVQIVSIALIILCFYQNLIYSDKYENKVERVLNMEFIKEVTNNIPHNTPYLFGSIQNSDPNKLEWANFNIYYPYDHFKLYFDNYNPVFLSLDNLKPGSTKKNHIVAAQPYYIETSPFYIFLKKKKEKTPNLSFNDGMALYIKEAKIKFLIVEQNSTIPNQISSSITKTIEDKETGFKLCILK